MPASVFLHSLGRLLPHDDVPPLDPQLPVDVFKSRPSTNDNKDDGGGTLARLGLPLPLPPITRPARRLAADGRRSPASRQHSGYGRRSLVDRSMSTTWLM